MSLAELVPALKSLARDEKLEVIRFLVSDLMRQQGIDWLQSGASYPVWTPFDAFEAARSLQQLLDEDGFQPLSIAHQPSQNPYSASTAIRPCSRQ